MLVSCHIRVNWKDLRAALGTGRNEWITTFRSTGEILSKNGENSLSYVLLFPETLHNAYYFRDSQLRFRCFLRETVRLAMKVIMDPDGVEMRKKTPIKTLEVFISGNYSYPGVQITEHHVQLDVFA